MLSCPSILSPLLHLLKPIKTARSQLFMLVRDSELDQTRPTSLAGVQHTSVISVILEQ